jgi:hypothetical protein
MYLLDVLHEVCREDVVRHHVHHAGLQQGYSANTQAHRVKHAQSRYIRLNLSIAARLYNFTLMY